MAGTVSFSDCHSLLYSDLFWIPAHRTGAQVPYSDCDFRALCDFLPAVDVRPDSGRDCKKAQTDV